MKKVISISLSPNVFPEDIAATKAIRQEPIAWRTGQAIQDLEKAFTRYFDMQGEYSVYTFNSGRSALLMLLYAFDIGKGDEVLLQAFTCNAVPNPIFWVGAKPVYVDVCEDTFNMNVEDLSRKITPRAKAIIVQHTFGLAADMEAILAIAKKHNLLVLEDCAHALGATYEAHFQSKGRKLGTLGDAAFFSFGRDKVISCVYGGLAFLKNEHVMAIKKMDARVDVLPFPSRKWIRQQLRHPVFMDTIMCFYTFPFPAYGIGKLLLRLLQLGNMLSKAVHWKEKQGIKPAYFPRRLPNALAFLALKQFERVDEFNAHRRKIAQYYYQELKKLEIGNWKLEIPQRDHIYLRFPVRHKHAHQIVYAARKKGILLGDWYDSVVAPHDTQLHAMLYQMGSCPVAETLAKETFNLPTNPNLSMNEARTVVEFLTHFPHP